MKAGKTWEGSSVQTLLIKLHLKLEEWARREEGQDIVEYALVAGLICFGATSTSQFLASGIATAFSNISSTMSTYTS